MKLLVVRREDLQDGLAQPHLRVKMEIRVIWHTTPPLLYGHSKGNELADKKTIEAKEAITIHAWKLAEITV